MKKVNVPLAFEDEKLAALEFSLNKESSSVQKKMDEALKQLYEKTVPAPLREYLDSRSATSSKPKRPSRTTPKSDAPQVSVAKESTAQEDKGSV